MATLKPYRKAQNFFHDVINYVTTDSYGTKALTLRTHDIVNNFGRLLDI